MENSVIHILGEKIVDNVWKTFFPVDYEMGNDGHRTYFLNIFT